MSIKKNIWILLLIFIFPCLVIAQQKISIEANGQLISRVLQEIEKKSNYKIYYLPQQLDSLYTTVKITNEDPLKIIEKVIQPTSIKMSVFKQSVFLLENATISDQIVFSSKGKPIDWANSDFQSTLAYIQGDGDKLANSEYKVYEIGKRNGQETKSKHTVNGYIYDFQTGESLDGVTIVIQGSTVGTTTDSKGFYSLQLPAGNHQLLLSGINLNETKRLIHVYSDGELDIEMGLKEYALDEVTVTSSRMDNVKSAGLGTELLKMKEIKNIPTAFGEKDVLKVVMTLPGVKSGGEISSGFNVRGGATDQNLILFNDNIIFNPNHLFGLFSAFNSDIIEDMELYKSSIPAKYGGRISSVLDIYGREGNKEHFVGTASIGLLTSRITLEGPLSKKTSILAGGRATYSDWLLGILPKKSGFQDGNAAFYDGNLMINHKFNDRDQLAISAYFSHDNFSFEDDGENYAYKNINGSIRWKHIFNPKFVSNYAIGWDHYQHETKDNSHAPSAYKLSFAIDHLFAKADFNYYLSNYHTLNFGLDASLYTIKPGKYMPTGDESLVLPDKIQKDKSLETAIYISDRWEVSSKLSLEYGIRYSLFNALGPRDYNMYDADYLPSTSTITGQDSKSGVLKTYHGPELRLSARYAFTNDFSIKAGINSQRQHIHKISNSTIMTPTDTWKLSDKYIKPQQGLQAAIGIYKNFLDGTIETSIEGYYKWLKDYLDYRNGSELIMNHHIETEVVPTKGKAYGVEVMIRKNKGKLNGWVSYTYARTLLRQNDKRISSPTNNGDWYPTDYDKPHEIKFVGNYKFTQRYSVSVNCDYSTGRPITVPVSKYEYTGGQFVYYSDRNAYRIPDYFRMDLSFNIEPSHRLTLLTHSTISIGVYNLTGRKNAHSVYYVNEAKEIKGYRLSIFGAPIPFISYNIRF